MARRTLFVLAATILLAALALPAVAGGGSCHLEPTTGSGDTVEMKDACFGPSALHVDPGDEVTFVNRDTHYTHNVSANGWGYLDDLDRGGAFQATFEESGVYPFACMYHPGMTGVIVVGDGMGAGNGEAVTVAPYRPPTDPESQALASGPVSNGASTAPVGWVAGGAIGLAVGLAGGLLVRRRGGASA